MAVASEPYTPSVLVSTEGPFRRKNGWSIVAEGSAAATRPPYWGSPRLLRHGISTMTS